jgi:hypothetical protein
MSAPKKGCAVCGKELVYMPTQQRMECFFCHKTADANAKCVDNHFVCDVCHSLAADELIETTCVASSSRNPSELALVLMRSPQVKMHGPEHHFMVPAVLIAAYYNTRNDLEKKAAKIKEARQRASKVLGGFCGFYGDCGAAVGTGIYLSLVTNTTPLSRRTWKLSNLMTAQSLLTIANHGGPRCCKRNTFLALKEAVNFTKENLGVTMEFNDKITCEFTDFNKECLHNECLFYAGARE